MKLETIVAKKSNVDKYPKLNSSFKNKIKHSTDFIKKMKIPCSSCGKNMQFFDFIRTTTTMSGIWESVWYCNNKGCNENKKFKY